MKKLFVMLLAVGLCAAAANADILLTSGPTYDVFITDPVSVGDGSEGLISFDLVIVNNTGDAGFDASAFDGFSAFGYTGITSGVFNAGTGLHNQFSTVIQPTSPTLDGFYATATDTHFLVNMAVEAPIVVTAPFEIPGDIGPSLEASDAVDPPGVTQITDLSEQTRGDRGRATEHDETEVIISYVAVCRETTVHGY